MMRRWLCLGGLFPALATQAAGLDEQAMLAAHNRWRDSVHVAPLAYSAELASSAQHWAQHLQQQKHCRMQHSQPQGRYGENLFWGSAVQWSDGRLEVQNIPPQEVVDSWAGERADYDYRINRCTPSKMCGHYTQVVWKSSTSVGCAMAVCADSREQIWVCQYQPAGNWVGEKPY